MAYMNQEKKKELSPQIKAVLKKYGMKGSISVRNYSTLVVTVKSGELNIPQNYYDVHKRDHEWKAQYSKLDSVPSYIDVNQYWIDEHYEGKSRDFLNELHDAMNGVGSDSVKNHNNSDIMTDYFDVGWYCSIHVGKFDKPFEVTA